MRVKISMPTQVNLILPLPSIHSNFERKYDPLIFSLLCIEFHWKFLSTFLKVIKTILVSFMITAWRFLFLKNLIVLFTTPWKYLVRWELVNVYLENCSKEFSLTGWKCSSNWYLAFPKNRLSKSFLVLELLRLKIGIFEETKVSQKEHLLNYVPFGVLLDKRFYIWDLLSFWKFLSRVEFVDIEN